MCGVAMLLNSEGKDLSPDQEERVGKGVQALFRRGPDYQNTIFHENIAIAHTRLAILDLNERSHQPFSIGDWIISFNGEIYNHLDLRKKIGDKYHFQTTLTLKPYVPVCICSGFRKPSRSLLECLPLLQLINAMGRYTLFVTIWGLSPYYIQRIKKSLSLPQALKLFLEMMGRKGGGKYEKYKRAFSSRCAFFR